MTERCGTFRRSRWLGIVGVLAAALLAGGAPAERNIVEDCRKAFGEEPPMISGVAIMTDTDNTGESATAHYGDIHFRR